MDNPSTGSGPTPDAGAASDGGLSPQARRDAESRVTLERVAGEIFAREEAAEEAPTIIHDEHRAKAKSEREAKNFEDYWSKGLPPYQGSPATLRDSLNAAADRAFAREADAKRREMPPVEGDLRERLEKSREWADLSETDQRTFRGAHDEMESQREAAKFFGLSLEEAKIAAIERRLAERDQVSPLLQRVAKIEPGRAPEATLAAYTGIAERFKTDPRGAITDLARQTGSLDALASEVEQRAIERGISGMVDRFSRQAPDFEALVPAMTEALERGLVRKTGHAVHDLRNAYAFARRYTGGRGHA